MTRKCEHFNVYAKNGKLIESNVTADYIKEEYECKNPWRVAKHGLLFAGKYNFVEVENEQVY